VAHHARPIFVRPQFGRFHALRERNLVQVAAEALKRFGFAHRQAKFNALYQGGHVERVAEVVGIDQRVVEGIAGAQFDDAPGAGTQKHRDH